LTPTRARNTYEEKKREGVKEKERERERGIDSARLPLFVLTEKQFPTSRRRAVNVLAGVQYCLLYIIPRKEKKESEGEREREKERRGVRGSMSRAMCNPFSTPDAGARDKRLESY